MFMAKAIVGALIAGGSTLLTALDDGGVTASEGVASALAALVALGAVFGVKNTVQS